MVDVNSFTAPLPEVKAKLLKLKTSCSEETRNSLFKITIPVTSECFQVDYFTFSNVTFTLDLYCIGELTSYQIILSCLQQAAICLCNVVHHGPEYLTNVLHLGGMDAFVNIIKSPDQESVVTGLQFVEMALRIVPASKELFEVAEGVPCLEALEYSCNETVAHYANELLDTYFMEEGSHDDENSEREGESCEGGMSPWQHEDNEMTT